ncbi:MAG: sigma-54-dependent Fis family transcriptional regulator [Phycisphaerae bacterium]|nr:sigma-54-dependent Fis family transcriptional regulator [Phycisphaerae bacterium]
MSETETAFVLIVEDERAHGDAIAEGLKREGHACRVVESGQEAVSSMKSRPPDVVITDYKLGGDMDGLDVLHQAKTLVPDAEVVMITAHGDEQLARRALKDEGAYDYLTKPLDLDDVRTTVSRAARQALSSRQNRVLRGQLDKKFSFEGIIGSGSEMARILKIVRQVADSKITVLIVGDSGTGKDLIAHAIHRNSPRKNKPLLISNCAAYAEGVLESELFGHVKGAFTGASGDRRGVFEEADGGTLFLDEVGDMPQTMQAKVLRAIENGEIVPVGSNKPVHVDVRLIAATHQDLRQKVRDGSFREDLFYRLNQVTLRVPPLRSRREDIPLLIEHFIQRANEEHGKEVRSITPEAVRRLTNYHWEGNVRELENTISAMVVLAETPTLDVEDIPDPIRGSTEIVPAGQTLLAGRTLEEIERLAIADTLKLTQGNRERAAKVLGIGARTLYRKLKEYGIN